jgi:hypothetical protein
MNKSEIKELMFEQVEASDFADFRKLDTGELVGFRKETTYPFIVNEVEYKYIRKIKPKEKRLMTAQELAGKWLVWLERGEEKYYFVGLIDTRLNMIGSWDLEAEKPYKYVRNIPKSFRINDKPSLDGATSLEVEK